VSPRNRRRHRVRAHRARTEGKICARCSRILTVTERAAGRTTPPALCRNCTRRELAEIEMALVALALRRRTGKTLRKVR